MIAVQPSIEQQPSRALALAVPLTLFFGSLLLYLLTLCPGVFWYDSAEYAVAAVTRGIPHPPGYPLYTLLGAVFVALPFDPAYSMNLMSAIFAALAVTLLYAVSRKLGAGILGAAVGATALALSRVFWSQALIAEAYTPGLAFLLAALWLLLHGREQLRLVWVLLAGLLIGLGLGVHLSLATAGLAFALLVVGYGQPSLRSIFSGDRLGRRFVISLAALAAFVLGTCIFLYVPWRAAQGPELNFQNPASWSVFFWMVSGGTYQGLFLRDYSFFQQAGVVAKIFYDQFLVVGLILAVGGAVALCVRRRVEALAMLSIVAGNTFVFFNYGVHDLEVFFLPTIAILALLIGFGAEAGVELLRGALANGPLAWLGRLGPIFVAGFALSLLPANYEDVDLSSYTAPQEYGERLCRELPKNALILNLTTPPEWKGYTVFLYYQLVKRKRRDVVIDSRIPFWKLVKLMRQGRAVYVFFPMRQVRQSFSYRKEAGIYRLTGPRRPNPATRALP